MLCCCAAPRPGAFCGLRLLPGQELEALLPELHRGWAQALLKEPPYCMRWLRTLNASERVSSAEACTNSNSTTGVSPDGILYTCSFEDTLALLHCSVQVLVVRCITDSSAAAEQVLGAALWDRLTQDQRSQLLVLRGLLGCSLLAHSLQKRHGVAYGVNRQGWVKKGLVMHKQMCVSFSVFACYAQDA